MLTKIDPLTYAVDPMRRAIFTRVSAPPELLKVLGILFFGLAVVQFSRQEQVPGSSTALNRL